MVWYFVHGVWYKWYMFNGGGHDYKTPHSGVLAWGGPQSNRHISPAVYISTLCIYQHFVYLSVIIFYNLSHITNSKISTISYIVMLATDCMSLFEGIRFVNCIRKQWSGVG